MAKDATLNDIFETVNFIKDNAVTKDEFSELKADVSGLKADVSGLKADVVTIKSTMVTKDYLDDKLSDLRGDLTVIMRKENTKVKMLVDLLVERRVLRDEDRKRLFSMEPFPEMSI